MQDEKTKILNEYLMLYNQFEKNKFSKSDVVKGYVSALGGVTVGTMVTNNYLLVGILGILISGASFSYLLYKEFVKSGWPNYEIREHSYYKEILKEYKNSISIIAETLAEKTNGNPVSIMAIYYHLLEQGFFSHNHNFIVESSIIGDMLYIDMGLDIVYGHGFCRNKANHLNAIFNSLGLMSTTAPCSISSDFHSLKYFLDINVPIRSQLEADTYINIINYINNNKNKLSFDEWFGYYIGNHMINGVEYQGNTYWIDVSMNQLYRTFNSKKLEVYHKDILRKFGMEKIHTDVPIKDTTSSEYGSFCNITDYNRKTFNRLMQNPNIELDEIHEEYLKGMSILKENYDVWNKLYEQNKDSYQKIVASLNLFYDAVCEQEKIKLFKMK